MFASGFGPTSQATVEKYFSGSRFLARQQAPVSGQHGLSPCDTRCTISRATAARQEWSALKYLAKKDPQRDQRRVDPAPPACINLFKCVGDRFDRQDVGKWQPAILKKLPTQEPDLLRCLTVTEAFHPWPPCRF